MFCSKSITRWSLALVVSLMAFAAQAKDLSDSTIQAFIASLNDAQELQDKYEDTEGWPDPESEDMASMPDMTRLFSNGVEQMEGTPAYDEFEAVVEKRGFDNLESWASVGDRVFAAMMAINMKKEGADSGAGQEMAKAMAEIENNPNMSEQQKAQMRAMMGAALSITKMADDVPAADIEAIRPHLKDLEAVMGDDEEWDDDEY
ncbi:hypothetical protein [Marinobacter sp. S6332]|uniref:hypothetical protein n=1 Tax=Marinobacter sp. S6332 TaxID=2926403 RepID=UPI001FF3B936|nr:hypothetical protein [Marinobacter sp. S6332]MCK0162514.1 hypothetical protein [Marinobacter sp. S6332]